eukprot:gene7787-9136_t
MDCLLITFFFYHEAVLPAKDLQQLVNKILNIPGVKKRLAKPKGASVNLVDRDSAVAQLQTGIRTLHSSYTNDSGTKFDHFFMGCMTGSGMGKTTFGLEASKLVTIPSGMPLVHITIDFNGGDRLLYTDMEAESDLSLAKRIFARGVLGVPYKTLFKHYTFVDEEEEILTLANLFSFIANRKRQQLDLVQGSTVAIFLHIDEFQIAHRFASNYNKKDYVKDMLYSLGDYRCRESELASSDAKDDCVFLIPLLTGTTVEGFEILFTRYPLRNIDLCPLTVDSSISYLTEHFPDLKSLLTHRLFRILIEDLEVAVSALGALVSKKIGEIPSNAMTERLLEICITGTNVEWTTEVKDKVTIQQIAYDGLVILSRSNNTPEGMFQVYLPVIILHKLCNLYNLTDLMKIVQFPYIGVNFGLSFEESVVSILVSKVNVLAQIKSNYTLKSILPGIYAPRNSADPPLLLCPVSLNTDTCKWILGPKIEMKINKDQIGPIQQNRISRCCYGTNCFDIRAAFLSSTQESVIVPIQTKMTCSDGSFQKQHVELMRSAVTLLAKVYSDSKIIPVVNLETGSLSDAKDFWYYDSSNIGQFFGMSLMHRVTTNYPRKEFPCFQDLNMSHDIMEEVDDPMEEDNNYIGQVRDDTNAFIQSFFGQPG